MVLSGPVDGEPSAGAVGAPTSFPAPLSLADTFARMAAGNVLRNLPPPGIPDEEFTTLGSKGSTSIRRIVSRGHASPEHDFYDQSDDEFVLVVSGSCALEFAGNATLKEMQSGDWLVIPAHCRHRVAWTDKDEATVWLVVHY
jgi:cupin 2 domain-containing protein